MCRGFVNNRPRLENAPLTNMICPPGVLEVTKRFLSEESRFNSTAKMIYFHELRDHIFWARTDTFHWDLTESVETNTERGRHMVVHIDA